MATNGAFCSETLPPRSFTLSRSAFSPPDTIGSSAFSSMTSKPEKLDEKAIREIETAQRELLRYMSKYMWVFAFVPKLLSRFMFQGRLRTVARLRQRQIDLFLLLISARRENQSQASEQRFIYSYIDSLLDISLAEEGGSKLTDLEIIPLCSEFLIARNDTTMFVCLGKRQSNFEF
ncbi:hypothetical protein M5K25_001936 [Dendrobium thyrsiflorum]|uniref:Uncharacterized protein n=1 Tax=Dendrobium thyrsiflorum TaxID=117978 RepID=A0ABD0W1B7_DENTH